MNVIHSSHQATCFQPPLLKAEARHTTESKGQKLSPKKVCVIALTSIVLFLNGCANTPQQLADTEQQDTRPTDESYVIPNREFTTDTLYALLVAEMALDRKRYDVALGNYVQQANATRDPRVAARATHIARVLKARKPALEMSQLWASLDPNNEEAKLVAIAELIEADQLNEALDISTLLLETGKATAFDSIAVQAEKGHISRVQYLIGRYQSLLNTYQEHGELWVGYSILLQQDGQLEEALDAAKKGKKLDKNSIQSTFQETRVLQAMGKQDLARERLAALVEANPDNIGLRARYARIVSTSDLEEAGKQFTLLHEKAPHDADILFSLGLVEKEQGKLSSAQQRFELLIARGQHSSSAHFHLANIMLRLGRNEEAVTQFMQVEPGQHYVSSMAKATEILIGTDQKARALELLEKEKSRATGTHQESLYLLESDIHSQAGQMSVSETALNAGLKAFPQSTRLLYARAMLYTRIDYISGAERDLKQVLEIMPLNAAALNALGYTLADKTERFEEAYGYIKKAFELNPNDPAVMDSMGWVAYRLGNYEEALSQLEQAMSALPDHEIAAHLGEVLWVTGQQERAIDVWKQGLKLKPQSKIIHQTIHRLDASLEQ